MSLLQDIFTEYARMRQNGLEVKDALDALKPYISPLPKNERNELSQRLRVWEKEKGEAQASSAVDTVIDTPHNETKSSVIKPIKPVSGAPFADSASGQTGTVICTKCGKTNKSADVFCFSCGNIIAASSSQFATQHFADSDLLVNDDYFGPDSVLYLELRDSQSYYQVRPQLFDHELVIGRSTGNSAMMPDVDLVDFGGAELGVSRLHMSIKYQPQDNTIQVYDLGSANGSFINGQRLHTKEIRLLRNSDEVRLGKLVMRVHFRHDEGSAD